MAQVLATGRSRRLRSSFSRKVTFAIGLLFAVLGGLLVAFAPNASAATNPSPITAYDTYPQASLVPAGCDTTKPDLTGLQFSLPGQNPTRDLATLGAAPGDVITRTREGVPTN